jgi:hypothetical protein
MDGGTRMRSRGTRRLVAALAAFAALLVASAPAQAFRCGTRIITRGDHAEKLRHYCGEPIAIQTRLAQRSLIADFGQVFLPGLVEDVWIEEWTYNLGPSKLMRVVRIENGVVAEIRHLGRGY